MTTHLQFTAYTDSGKVPLVLVHSLGLGPAMFDPLTPLLADGFDVVFATLPGHSGEAPASSAFTISDLANEISQLATTLGWDRYGYLGVSIGGAIGLELSRIDSRVMGAICVSAAATFGAQQMWQERADHARTSGTAAFVEPSRSRWFSADFLESNVDATERLLNLLATCDGPSYAAACDAISGFNFAHREGTHGQPILIMNGSEDLLVTPAAGEAAAALVENAEARTVDAVAHLGPSEKPEVYASAINELFSP